MPAEMRSCVRIMAHNYAPSPVAHTFLSEQTDKNMMTHEWRGKFSGSYISFFSIPTGLTHAVCLLKSYASVGPYKHALPQPSDTHTVEHTQRPT